MTALEQYISSFFGVPDNDLTAIANYFQPQQLRKQEYYLKAGQVCDTLSFQHSGLTRFFVQLPEKEVTQWIGTPAYFVTDLNGLFFGKPARCSIQALEDCELFTIHRKDYQQLGEKIPSWHELEKRFIARCFTYMEDRVFNLLAMSAEQRYQWLFGMHPGLFNQVPLQYLASMLGMTPETLSRIRKKQLS
ncbi:MAG: Crp/Fnr family transcriptional regulator [Chitinophaga sp.]|uniref:Crp/Fnr family transcriptional regulator n=1 Tax=Chitinophaga sp. TaxID=1869181 RepID=UPI0025C510A8|nr:Crp/Fnr family transcriptional regulator [Chitinophaga sp.]MBV8251313.1 Crp/Fnr family transcriptional regulator [Chitinophaga sp.]